MPRIGLFGGSFDPVHEAHLALARAALGQLALDELVWVPTGNAWQKQRILTPAADREAMLRSAIEGEARFTVSRAELEREGPSYMIDTVNQLRAARPPSQWFLLIGQDQHAGFHSWHRWRELLGRVTLAVAGRPGAGAALAPEVEVEVEVERAGLVRLAMPLLPVSSTEVRARVAAGRSIDGLVPAAVARYIARHHLYRAAGPQGGDEEIPVGN